MGMTPEQGIILQFDAARSLAVNRRKTHHVTEQRPHRIGPQPLLLYPHAEDAIHDDGLLIPNIPLDLQISPVFVLQDLATDGVSTDLQDFRDRGRGRFDIDNGPWFHEDGQDGLAGRQDPGASVQDNATIAHMGNPLLLCLDTLLNETIMLLILQVETTEDEQAKYNDQQREQHEDGGQTFQPGFGLGAQLIRSVNDRLLIGITGKLER